MWITWALGPASFGVAAVLFWWSPDYWLGPTPNRACTVLPILAFTHLAAASRIGRLLLTRAGPRPLEQWLLCAYFALLLAFVSASAMLGVLRDGWREGTAGTVVLYSSGACLAAATALVPAIPLARLVRWCARGRGAARASPPS